MSNAPTRSGPRRSKRPQPKGGNALILFLAFGAAPLAGLGWFFFQSAERQQELLSKIPAGVGGRVLRAAICLGVLVALAALALPAFHGARKHLASIGARMREARGIKRVLLFPVEALVGLLLFVVQICYAVDVLLILLAALALLLATVRIIKPDFLPELVPQLSVVIPAWLPLPGLGL